MPTIRLNYDSDPPKHYVRINGWLPAALDQLDRSAHLKRPIAYFTFCASNAIDVFLFLNEGILRRNPETGIIENAYFCEKKAVEFTRITDLFGASEPGFLGDFTDILLFEDDAETVGLNYLDEDRRYSRHLRRRLATKRAHERFRELGPLDILNLDICGTFFPPAAGMHSPMLRAVERLMNWQAEHARNDAKFRSFTVFFTTHVETGLVNDEALTRLINVLHENQDCYPSFADRISYRFGTTDVEQVAVEKLLDFYSIALPKTIVSVAFESGWLARPTFSGFYRRTRGQVGIPSSTYEMFCWVVRFDWNEPHMQGEVDREDESMAAYEELVGNLTSMPVDVDRLTEKDLPCISESLSRVVASRDEYLEEVRSAGH